MSEITKCWNCGSIDLIYSPKVHDPVNFIWSRVVKCKKCKEFKIIKSEDYDNGKEQILGYQPHKKDKSPI